LNSRTKLLAKQAQLESRDQAPATFIEFNHEIVQDKPVTRNSARTFFAL
jgi:hypothetical protein